MMTRPQIKQGIHRVVLHMLNRCTIGYEFDMEDDFLCHFMIYIQRYMQKNPAFLFQKETEVYVFVICIFNLALKMNYDTSILNTEWTNCMSSTTLEQFNQFEIDVIQKIGWENLAVTDQHIHDLKTNFSFVVFLMQEEVLNKEVLTGKRKFSGEEDNTVPETPVKIAKNE